MAIDPGSAAEIQHVVAHADTAASLRSGDVDVLGTPAVVALCERAAVTAIAASLEPEQTSVGTHVTVDHVAPTTAGGRIVARAELQRVEGRTLYFLVEVSDETGVIARGSHTRVIVDRARFMNDAEERSGR